MARQYRRTAKRARDLAALVKDGRLDDTVYHLYSEEAARSTLALIRGTDSSKEPTPRQIAEHGGQQCARYVAALIRTAHRNEIPLDRAKSLAWLAQVLAGLIGDAEVDARISALEKRLAAYEATRL